MPKLAKYAAREIIEKVEQRNIKEERGIDRPQWHHLVSTEMKHLHIDTSFISEKLGVSKRTAKAFFEDEQSVKYARRFPYKEDFVLAASLMVSETAADCLTLMSLAGSRLHSDVKEDAYIIELIDMMVREYPLDRKTAGAPKRAKDRVEALNTWLICLSADVPELYTYVIDEDRRKHRHKAEGC